MDVFSIARACLRRWYVLIPLLVITAALAYLQGRSIAAQYSANASTIVVAPNLAAERTSPDTPLPVNPLGSAGTAQTALVERLNSAQFAAQVAQSGATGGFSAVPRRSAAIIQISVVADSASSASTTLDAVLNGVPNELKTLQDDLSVPSGSYYRVATLTGNQGVAVDYPSRSKNIVLVALAGTLLSILLAQLLDALLLARRRPKPYRARRGASKSGDTDPASSDSAQPSDGVAEWNSTYPHNDTPTESTDGSHSWSPTQVHTRDADTSVGTPPRG